MRRSASPVIVITSMRVGSDASASSKRSAACASHCSASRSANCVERALGGGDGRGERARRFGSGLVPVAGERCAVAVEVIGAQALDRLRDGAVEPQSPRGRDFVEQRLLHERVREAVAHGRAAELVEQARDASGFERVDHLFLAIARNRNDHVELEVLAGDRGAVQHRVARVGERG